MVRLIVILIVSVLFFGHAQAQIPNKRDSLVARVCANLRISTSGTANVSTATIYQKLNDAQTPVCQDFDAFEKFDTLVISSGAEGATLPSDFLRVSSVDRMVRVDGSTPLRIPMQEIDPKERWEKAASLAGAYYNLADSSQPRYYYVHGPKLLTYPKDRKPSNRPDTLLLGYWAIGHNLISGTDTIDIRPDFREALILKATALLWRVRYGAASPEAAAVDVLYVAEVAKYGRIKK